MRFTLFSRLVLGYLAIFFLVMAVGIYAVYQLRRIQEITRSVIERDRRLLDLGEKLGDALLSQVRYEKKFLITKDQVLYDQFLLFQKDFQRLLDQAIPVADARARSLLNNVGEGYQRYQELVAEEVDLLKGRKAYAEERYQREKET